MSLVNFNYKKDDATTFKIGKLTIGNAKPNSEGRITPADISAYNGKR